MDDISHQFQKYRQKGILIDTNILLLFIVGYINKGFIPNFIRTKIFTIEDFDYLIYLINYFDKIITTPNILTETSNLLNQLPDHLKQEYYQKSAYVISKLNEYYKNSEIISGNEYFSKFGLTDTGIIEEAKGKYLVLTDDLKLSGFLTKNHIDVINFNHIRMMNWKF